MISKRTLPMIAALALVAQSARADDFLFSEASFPVVAPLLLAWLIAGFVLRMLREDFVYFGPVGAVLIVLGVFFSFGHVEIVLIVWMIYLALLTVYFALPRESMTTGARRLNLFFHGAFLLAVIVGGVIAKVLFYSRIGGFAHWIAQMRDNSFVTIVLFAICGAFVLARFISGVVNK